MGDPNQVSAQFSQLKQKLEDLGKLKEDIKTLCKEFWKSLMRLPVAHPDYEVGDPVFIMTIDNANLEEAIQTHLGIIVGEAIDALFQENLRPVAIFTGETSRGEKYARVETNVKKRAQETIVFPPDEFKKYLGNLKTVVPPDVEVTLKNFEETKRSFRSRHTDIYGLVYPKILAKQVRAIVDQFGLK